MNLLELKNGRPGRFCKLVCKRGHLRNSDTVYKNGACRACMHDAKTSEVYKVKRRAVKPSQGRLDYNRRWKQTAYGRWRGFLNGVYSTYGLTEIEYLRLLYKNRGRCHNLFCSFLPTEESRRLAIDHDHKTGKVRGLLCIQCNTALERVEKENILNGLLEYLHEEHDHAYKV